MALFVLSLCPFDISVGIGAFVIGLGQISSFLSLLACNTRCKCSYGNLSQLGKKSNSIIRSSSVSGSKIGVMYGGCHCIWSFSRMSCNIQERGTSYCLIRSPYLSSRENWKWAHFQCSRNHVLSGKNNPSLHRAKKQRNQILSPFRPESKIMSNHTNSDQSLKLKRHNLRIVDFIKSCLR